MPFEFKHQAGIYSVKVRRGSNEESNVAIDIDMKLENVPPEVIAGALRCETRDVVSAFFKGKDGDEPRFLGLGSVPILQNWEGVHGVKISNLPKMRCINVRKLKWSPTVKGLGTLTLQVTVEEPPENYIEAVADKLHRSVMVTLSQDQDELPLESGSEEEEEEEEA